MSETRAIALKTFLGAPDGDPYPAEHLRGDPVAGDLADVAIGQKWAREAKDAAEYEAAVAARATRLAPPEEA
jgi:hypothetical protein